MGTVWTLPCTRLVINMNILLLFCLAFSPSFVIGLAFDPFRSLLLSLKESVENGTLEHDVGNNQTWVDTFHKIINDDNVNFPTEATSSSTTANVVTIPSSTQTRAASLLKEKLGRFIPVNMAPDPEFLTENEKSVLAHLIKAAELMDPIYERQVWTQNPERRRELGDQYTQLSRLQLEYYDIMRGPWDRSNQERPFAIDRQKPAGAGFYPEDMAETQLQFYIGSNPDKKDSLESPVTLVKTQQQAAVYPVPLYGVPYSTEYKEWLEKAAQFLKETAEQTEDPNFKEFLLSRSEAFTTNDYDKSDKDWLDINSRVQIAIGPYRTDEDKLKGLKKSFEAIVYILEQTFKPKFRTLLPETKTAYAQLTPQLEADLPVPEEVKNKSPQKTSIDVAELVYAAGSARKYPQLFSYSYPTNSSVIQEKGQRKIVLSNIVFSFYENILTKISERIVKTKQRSFLDEDAFFMLVLYQEISHSLGPIFVGNDEARGTLKNVYGDSHEPLEEAKAGVLGVYNILRKIEKEPNAQPDFKNKVLFTYITYLLQLIRDGASRPEGQGAAIQLNQFLEDGSVVLLESPNPDAEKYQVNFKKVEISLNKLVKDLIVLQHKGDKEAVVQLVRKYGALGSKLNEVKEQLEDIPVDISAHFKPDKYY